MSCLSFFDIRIYLCFRQVTPVSALNSFWAGGFGDALQSPNPVAPSSDSTSFPLAF
eukprot:NODE_9050_length_490_cov_6.473923_g7976_i0.p1 GENE.NODE_9050_length_490_cov_6.473923_g7976_i0~~NODE_9050_length_490_cov_6.473923_g7976_i0.p1  ORF type:complete len:56 (+),score=7.65 NODE_9050_length_490_cov_6.473923_g7976_i0:3-170(+)